LKGARLFRLPAFWSRREGGREGGRGVPDLLEVVEVELADQGLEAGVTEVLGQNLAFQAGGVLDVEGKAI